MTCGIVGCRPASWEAGKLWFRGNVLPFSSTPHPLCCCCTAHNDLGCMITSLATTNSHHTVSHCVTPTGKRGTTEGTFRAAAKGGTGQGASPQAPSTPSQAHNSNTRPRLCARPTAGRTCCSWSYWQWDGAPTASCSPSPRRACPGCDPQGQVEPAQRMRIFF